MKKSSASFLTALLILPLAVLFLHTPQAQAIACPDMDGDGYITLNSPSAVLVFDATFLADGNYTPAQWQNYYDQYKAAVAATPDPNCDNVTFKKGSEPVRCDATLVAGSSGVYDSSKLATLSGNKVNPGAYDIPSNGIDEDCDGADGQFIANNAPGAGQDLGGLVQRGISLLGKVVVTISVVIMIWGGILYATAAGDEQKTAKARKAIIGAIIGLLVGLLAPAIVNWIATTLG